MQITPYHAKYFAFELTKRSSSDSLQKLASSLLDAQVDLNPHQVEAALFAFHSPLSKGAILLELYGLVSVIDAYRLEEVVVGFESTGPYAGPLVL